jgi:CDP-diacylglycerol---glycerol-3-phosphate 3-phosphatidyltransferase
MGRKTSPQQASTQIYNVPNALTLARFVLAILVFVMIPLQRYEMALILFVVAASTDWMDGYWARKYDQVTQLGRVFDPFVDKIIICGAFVLLAVEPGSGIAGWIAVVVVGRELLVTALRGYMEAQGIDFSAKWSGKWKMVFQCLAVIVSLYSLMQVRDSIFKAIREGKAISEKSLSRFGEVDLAEFYAGDHRWMYFLLLGSIWVAVLLTIYSGLVYMVAAAKHLRKA